MSLIKTKYKNDNNHNVEIEVNLLNYTSDIIYIDYKAAAPADSMTSFSGSGLPYVSEEQAYYNTPNIGRVKSIDNKVYIKLLKPNSYYKDFNVLQKPHILLYNNDQFIADILIEMEEIGNRSLQYIKVRFYQNENRFIQSQENILKSTEYIPHPYK